MISIYTTAFNLKEFNIDFDDAFSNWLCYADEIVIGTLRKEFDQVRDLVVSSKYYDPKKIGVVSRHLDIFNDIYWDGKLKDAALKNCRHDIVLQVDLDERIAGEKEGFEELSEELLRHDFPCSVMLPYLNLYKDINHFLDIGYKWYLHKREGTRRGTVNFAIKEDGCFDPEKSDTCELIDEEGNLIPCIAKILFSVEQPKIIHLGFLDLERRAHLNKKFWRDIWSKRKSLSQKKEVEATDVLINASEFEPAISKHGLPNPIWPTL
jgi:hypothetical protein